MNENWFKVCLCIKFKLLVLVVGNLFLIGDYFYFVIKIK